MSDIIRFNQAEVEATVTKLSSVSGNIQETRNMVASLVSSLEPSISEYRMFDSTMEECLNQMINKMEVLSERSGNLSDKLNMVVNKILETEAAIAKLGTGTQEDSEPHSNEVGYDADKAPEDEEYHWQNMPTNTKEEYDRMIQERHDHAIDSESRELYDKWRKRIHIGTDTVSDGAYYDSIFNQVFYNWEEDGQNVRGQGNTYYHEIGHMLDDYTKLVGDSSSSKAFTNALENDFLNYVSKTMAIHNCDREKAYEYISEWLCVDGNNKNGISDLCGGLTKNACEGYWGHGDDYWQGKQEHGIPDKVNNEAFAHFFEASMCTDTTKLDYIREIFPNAYNEYKKIVRSAL